MAEIRAEVTVRGVPAALFLLNSVPGDLVGPTVEGSLRELLEEGIALMQLYITELIRSEKSTGVLAESVQGFREAELNQSRDDVSGTVNIKIGSAIPYAEYAAREIGWSSIDKYVLLQTGRWVWIGNRPPIPAHPFLEYTLGALLTSVMPKSLGQNFIKTSIKIQSNIDALQRSESLPGVKAPE